ncbi:MAG: DUF4838 domain-containing protein [Lentisphaeria bacterium]
MKQITILLLLITTAMHLQAQNVYQFSDADIILPTPAPGLLRLAAEELQKHLRQLTGGDFAIRNQAVSEFALLLGVSPESEKLSLKIEALPRDGFYIAAAEKRICILGKDNLYQKPPNLFFTFYDCQDRGTLLAVYEFLEQQGIRWPAPGEINTYIPPKKLVSVPLGVQKHQPVFRDRLSSDFWNFMQKYPDSREYCQNVDEIFLWGLRLKLSGRTVAIGCHTEQFLKLPEIWQDYPERFQLMRNGERNKNYLCWTDPAVEEVWSRAADAFFSGKSPAEAGLPHLQSWRGQNSPREFFLDPMDHGGSNDGRCLCQRCQAFRQKNPSPDDSEIIWKVIASVAEKMREKHPGKFIATLVYPPKHQLPKSVALPDNICVRICVPGAKSVAVPQRLQLELQKIKEWSDILGAENVPLWTYQCEIHGRKLPGPPETYPGLFATYLQKIRPLAAGVNNEIHALSHTYRNLDMYIQARLLWDPERDLATELREYFQCYYGAAAPVLQALFQRFENNWVKYWRLVTPDSDEVEKVGLAQDGANLRKIIWSQVYTQEEMQHIDQSLQEAEALAVDSPPVLRRVKLLRSYLFEIMQEERYEVMQMRDLCPTIEVSNDDWQQIKPLPLVSASRLKKELQFASYCQVRVDADSLYLQVRIEAANPELSLTDPQRKNGDRNIWRDNVVEVFFYDQETLTQLMINDLGIWSSQQITNKTANWQLLPDVQIKIEKTASGYLYSLHLPRRLFSGQSLLFNVTRTRRVKNSEEEVSTLSPASKLGNWHNPESYAILQLQP